MKKYMKGEFSVKKLNTLEKDLNKMYARNKVLKPITFTYMIFSFLLFGFMTVILITEDPNAFANGLWLVAIICLITTTIISTIPFCIYLEATDFVNNSLSDYSKKKHIIEKILDKWWVEIDPQERRKREQYAARKKYSGLSSSHVYPFSESTGISTSHYDHGPLATAANCGMPYIDM